MGSADESIAGVVDHVIFHNEESGFCVFTADLQGMRGKQTVVGSSPSVSPGEYVNATGQWTVDRRHGKQFKAETLRITPPSTHAGIEKYLASGIIKGIGPHLAGKLVHTFGEKVFDVIDDTPELLMKVNGIGKVRRERITEAWAEQKVVREIMVFLQSHGVSTARAFRIYKEYGNAAIDVVRENPYRLVLDIHGIGFRSADQIAEHMGMEKTSMMRAQAGVNYLLGELASAGHCAYPLDELIEKAVQLLEIPDDTVRKATERELAEGRLVKDEFDRTEYIYQAPLHYAETGLARRLRALIKGTSPLAGLKVEKALQWVQERIGMKLSASQQTAISELAKNKVLVITGGPGVGKTTLVRSILEILSARKLNCLLCAPTGRAAKRLSQVSGAEAKTIHRLLEFAPHEGGFRRNESNPLECDAVIVDEMSMVDLPLMYHLLKAVPREAIFVAVGDVDQLPSVGPGNVLSDLCGAETIGVVRLTEVFRQAAESRIIVNAHRINEGRMPDLEGDPEADFFFVRAETPEEVLSTIVELVTKRIPKRFGMNPLTDIQVLTPMNRAALGTHVLNAELQKVLNPPPGPEVTLFGTTFRTGDKVMQIRNNYDKNVFNGDIGVMTNMNTRERILTVVYDGREVDYDFNELDELVLAYACTIHKSQGSEYPVVVVPVHTQHYIMLQRNLIYTAVTRSRRLVVLVGTVKALGIAINNNLSAQRYSFLKERIQRACS